MKKADEMKSLTQGSHHAGLHSNSLSGIFRTVISLVFRIFVLLRKSIDLRNNVSTQTTLHGIDRVIPWTSSLEPHGHRVVFCTITRRGTSY